MADDNEFPASPWSFAALPQPKAKPNSTATPAIKLSQVLQSRPNATTAGSPKPPQVLQPRSVPIGQPKSVPSAPLAHPHVESQAQLKPKVGQPVPLPESTPEEPLPIESVGKSLGVEHNKSASEGVRKSRLLDEAAKVMAQAKTMAPKEKPEVAAVPPQPAFGFVHPSTKPAEGVKKSRLLDEAAKAKPAVAPTPHQVALEGNKVVTTESAKPAAVGVKQSRLLTGPQKPVARPEIQTQLQARLSLSSPSPHPEARPVDTPKVPLAGQHWKPAAEMKSSNVTKPAGDATKVVQNAVAVENAQRRKVEEEAKANKEAQALKEVQAKKAAEETRAKWAAKEAQGKKEAEEAQAEKAAEEAQTERETRAKKAAQEARSKKAAQEARSNKAAEEAQAKQLAEEAQIEQEARAKKAAEATEQRKRFEASERKKSLEAAEVRQRSEAASRNKAAEEALRKEAESVEAARVPVKEEVVERINTETLLESASEDVAVASAGLGFNLSQFDGGSNHRKRLQTTPKETVVLQSNGRHQLQDPRNLNTTPDTIVPLRPEGISAPDAAASEAPPNRPTCVNFKDDVGVREYALGSIPAPQSHQGLSRQNVVPAQALASTHSLRPILRLRPTLSAPHPSTIPRTITFLDACEDELKVLERSLPTESSDPQSILYTREAIATARHAIVEARFLEGRDENTVYEACERTKQARDFHEETMRRVNAPSHFEVFKRAVAARRRNEIFAWERNAGAKPEDYFDDIADEDEDREGDEEV